MNQVTNWRLAGGIQLCELKVNLKQLLITLQAEFVKHRL